MSTSTVAQNGNLHNKLKATTEEVTVTNNGISTKKVYFAATDFLSELPITFIEQMTELTKKKFSDDFLSTVSDEKLKGYRTQFLIVTISAMHKQHEKMVKERKEKKAREWYKELRSKGVTKENAVMVTGYNPDLE